MRNSARSVTVVTGVLVALCVSAVALAGPASASVPDTSYDAGPGLTVTETLGLFVGIPLLVILVVYGLVYGLSGRRGPRYPAGQPWTAEPEVFGEQPSGNGAADSDSDAQAEGGARGQW